MECVVPVKKRALPEGRPVGDKWMTVYASWPVALAGVVLSKESYHLPVRYVRSFQINIKWKQQRARSVKETRKIMLLRWLRFRGLLNVKWDGGCTLDRSAWGGGGRRWFYFERHIKDG
jgi:hypothetical protein